MSSPLEDQVREKLTVFFRDQPLSDRRVLVAVSGGADSVALLLILHKVTADLCLDLHAVTVDHRMRPESESFGDASFVLNACASLVPPVPCNLVRLDEGGVSRTAAERGKGAEEAARFLRYTAFEQTAEKLGCTCICTAHTRSDQLETVLMRFLQGGGTSSLAGIAVSRGPYLRPLLDAGREDIEQWLTANGSLWREDASNKESAYLRNRIRNSLVPFLDASFPGWRPAVLAAAEKAARDESALRSLPRPAWQCSVSDPDAGLSCPSADFKSLHPALRIRMLQDGLCLLGVSDRVPYRFLRRIADSQEQGRFAAAGLEFTDNGVEVRWKTDIVHRSKTGYLVTVSSPGEYEIPCSRATVSRWESGFRIDGLEAVFALPAVLRSRSAGDCVPVRPSTGSGPHFKTVKKLFSEWGVSERHRELVPIIESNGRIAAVYGSLFGYPDWINEEVHG